LAAVLERVPGSASAAADAAMAAAGLIASPGSSVAGHVVTFTREAAVSIRAGIIGAVIAVGAGLARRSVLSALTCGLGSEGGTGGRVGAATRASPALDTLARAANTVEPGRACPARVPADT
jgi:hypothetical protein